jgi:magnesium chelatase subunit I
MAVTDPADAATDLARPTAGGLGHAAPAGVPGSLGELRAAGYEPRSVKRELRDNTLRRLAELRERYPDDPAQAISAADGLFPGVVGYEDTVVPQLLQAVLSEHDTLLLGLRGQAKTRLLRSMVHLLDEWIPVIDHESVTIPDDPVRPTTTAGRRAQRQLSDDLPVRWLHRSERFHEKLATPDVTIADLIGEIDLIKHAEGRYLSDESTMHFGLVPRSNRGLFVMNELPDLSPRIQVGLFNVLEERDVQIRGYPIRLHLDVCLMFSANPEDYTNRGRIVTPLKDRIGSVVRTHYPRDLDEAVRITRGSAFVERRASGRERHETSATAEESPTPASAERRDVVAPPEVRVPDVMHQLVELTVAAARTSAHINQASGVSVRASIAAIECLVSAAELRAIRTGENDVVVRPSDASHIHAAFRGKIELLLADESSDGTGAVATEDRLVDALWGESIKDLVGEHVDVEDLEHIARGFAGGLRLEFGDDATADAVVRSLDAVDGLREAADDLASKLGLNAQDNGELACAGELLLEFLYVNNRLSKLVTRGGSAYKR